MAYEINTKVPAVIGEKALSQAGVKIRDELGLKKVMLVYDVNIEKFGNAAKVRTAFEEAGLECEGFNGCVPNAPETVCDELAAKAKEWGAEILVAIGGGSTMDTAKGACVILGNGGKMHDWLMKHPYVVKGENPSAAFGKPLPYEKSFPIVCIPTTAGTGSESGSWAVIHDEELNLKDCVMYEAKFAVIDPEMTVTCPPSVTVDCAFDAMAHAGESITSRRGSKMPYDTILGTGVTKMVFDNLYDTVQDPTNLAKREAIATAASTAGFCLNYATAHIGHAIADGLLYKFHFSHGYSCLLTLPGAIKIAAPYVPEQVKAIVQAQGYVLKGDETPEELGEIAAENYRALARKCGAKTPADRGISREDFISDETVKLCIADKLAVGDCPKDDVTEDDVRQILVDIYDKF